MSIRYRDLFDHPQVDFVLLQRQLRDLHRASKEYVLRPTLRNLWRLWKSMKVLPSSSQLLCEALVKEHNLRILAERRNKHVQTLRTDR